MKKRDKNNTKEFFIRKKILRQSKQKAKEIGKKQIKYEKFKLV
jgi:hypothetical protein